MKILITGSSGFVGTHLVNRLQKNNEIVKYDIKEGFDILDRKLLSGKLKGCFAVIHLAAYVSVSESWKKPYVYFENNGIGTLNVIQESIKSGIKRIINFSSAAVYGNPLTPYGASKLWGENVCEAYKNKIEITTLRPFNIYGLGQNPSYGYAIHNFIEGIKQKGRVTIYGDGHQTRDFIYIDDVVDVVEKMLTTKTSIGSVDVGTGIETSITDLAFKIGKILKMDFKVKYLEGKNEPYKSVSDTSKLKEINIDVSKFTKLDAGLRKLIDYEN